MKHIFMIAALALASCGEASSPSGEVASGKPPVRFRGDAEAVIRLSGNVEKACREAGLKVVQGTATEACAVIGGKQPVIIAANPCKQPGSYAATLCHEIGHVNGWPYDHGK